MDGPPLTPQAPRLHGQARQTPRHCPLKEGVQRYLAALHRPFAPTLAPAQVHHVGQGGAGQAPLVVDQLAGTQGDEDDANKIRGACGQHANHTVDRLRRQVYW